MNEAIHTRTIANRTSSSPSAYSLCADGPCTSARHRSTPRESKGIPERGENRAFGNILVRSQQISSKCRESAPRGLQCTGHPATRGRPQPLETARKAPLSKTKCPCLTNWALSDFPGPPMCSRSLAQRFTTVAAETAIVNGTNGHHVPQGTRKIVRTVTFEIRCCREASGHPVSEPVRRAVGCLGTSLGKQPAFLRIKRHDSVNVVRIPDLSV